MTFVDASLIGAAMSTSSIVVLPIDLATAWILYAAVLGVCCFFVWFTRRLAESETSRGSSDTTAAPDSPHLDDAA